MTPLLLDANVWLASLDPTHRLHAAAKRLLDSTPNGRPLAALDLTLYEVANVAVRTWRSPEDARAAVALVRKGCDGTLIPVDDKLSERAIALAAEHGLSVYDASYVAAAERAGGSSSAETSAIWCAENLRSRQTTRA